MTDDVPTPDNGDNAQDQTESKDVVDQGGAKDEPPKPELVEKERLDRAVDDVHKFKSKAKEYEDRLKAMEEERLREKEDYKTIAERRQQEAEEYKSKYDNLNQAVVNRERYHAVKDAAMKAGIRDVNDLDLLPLEDLQVETTSTGRINVLGAEAFIEKQKMLKPHWFGPKGAPNVNTNSVGVTHSGKVSGDDLVKLEREARKTGDYSKYKDAFSRYQKQRAIG